MPTNSGTHRGRIPLTIIGGFLGSGKTTLLNHLITHAGGRRFAVVVNDFGAINIDARLIVSVEGETVALTNGCICCVIREDLVVEVAKLCRKPDPPEHIIIEASGVSQPLAVVESFLRPETQTIIDVQNIITLLDADQVVDPAQTYADIAYAQIAVADLVVINKTDLVPASRLQQIRAKVETIVPRARIFETRFGAIPVEILFDHDISAAAAALQPGDAAPSHHDPHHHAAAHGNDHAFATWTLRDELRAYSFDALQRIVERLPRGIYRAKGLVRLDIDNGEHGVLQVTGRRGWLRLTAPEAPADGPVVTEVVFIGETGCASDEALAELFDVCWREANDPQAPAHLVTDLRAFRVEFL